VAIAADATTVQRFRRSALGHSFLYTPSAMVGAVLLALLVLGAVFVPVIAAQNPYDLSRIFIDKAELPPFWLTDGEWPFLLGTDPQGRDILSVILYGSRVSLMIGAASVLLAMLIEVSIGLAASFLGGGRRQPADAAGGYGAQHPYPAGGHPGQRHLRGLLPLGLRESFTPLILVFSIGPTGWVHYARTVRASTMVERHKEYVLAARIIGVSRGRIMRRHVLPNAMTPVLVAATLNLGLAILSEATLSFLAVGMPVTQPSLGTPIRISNQYLFSGSWWSWSFQPCSWPDRAVGQPAGRLAARCTQSETPLRNNDAPGPAVEECPPHGGGPPLTC
jgi:peptide/nickel transport system permease protein